jgi:hypothetical protein
MSKIRKALIAGVGTTVSAWIIKEGADFTPDWKTLPPTIMLGLLVGFAAWATPNAA